jgi:hypothetical protein
LIEFCERKEEEEEEEDDEKFEIHFFFLFFPNQCEHTKKQTRTCQK